MAKPIKETPILEGEDAKRFAEDAHTVKPESNNVVEKAKAVYEKFKKISPCHFNLWSIAN